MHKESRISHEMPPKGKAVAAPNKKTDAKKKEKIIEVSFHDERLLNQELFCGFKRVEVAACARPSCRKFWCGSTFCQC